MTEKLELGMRQKLLEIGTGSGYQTAVLASLCRRVFYRSSGHRELLREAERASKSCGCAISLADSATGRRVGRNRRPYERVIVTAAAPEIPATLVDGLVSGGSWWPRSVRITATNSSCGSAATVTGFRPRTSVWYGSSRSSSGLPRRQTGQSLT